LLTKHCPAAQAIQRFSSVFVIGLEKRLHVLFAPGETIPVLKERFDELQRELLSEIRSYYKDRLVSVVLFGSVARGTQRFESDLDLLVIAEDLPRGRMRRVREFMRVEERLEPFLAALKTCGIHTFLSPVIKSPEEALKGSPLFLDMVEDAKILFDRNGFFAGILERLRRRLMSLGARRRWRGDAWYWDLKPDLKPGEIFEL